MPLFYLKDINYDTYNVMTIYTSSLNHTGGVMVNMLALSLVDSGYESRYGQTTDFKMGICCFSANHAPFRSERTDWWS